MDCPNCKTAYPPAVKLCVKCGINLATGKPLHTHKIDAPEFAPEPDAGEPTEPRPRGVIGYLGDSFPGLFRPAVLVASIVAGLIGLAVIVICPALLILAPLSAFGVGAGGLIIFAQAVTWLIMGDFSLFQQAMPNFRGKDWTAFIVLVAAPFLAGMLVMIHAQHAQEQAEREQSDKQLAEMTANEIKAEPLAPPSKETIVAVSGSAIGHTMPIAVDSKGAVYFAERNQVNKMDSATGAVKPAAGIGAQGMSGNNGPAIKAMLNNVNDITVDAHDNLYIVDSGLVRKVDSEGVIHDLTGTDGPGQSRIAVDANGNIYILDSQSRKIFKVDATSVMLPADAGARKHFAGGGAPGYAGDGGPAVAAQFFNPVALAVDAQGNLYVADSSDLTHVVRRIDAATGKISTVAGGGRSNKLGDGGPATQARLNNPANIACDNAGNLYIADAFNRRVRKVDTKGVISTYAGDGRSGTTGDGGPANRASFDHLTGLGVDAKGNVYIHDREVLRMVKGQ